MRPSLRIGVLCVAGIVCGALGADDTRPPPGIVALVNGSPITSFQLERELERRIGDLRATNSAELLAEHRDRIRRDVLDELILMRLLLERCDAEKIEVTDRELDGEIQRRIDQLKEDGYKIRSMNEFFTAVKEQTGETEDEVRARVRAEVRVTRLYGKRVFLMDYIPPGELRSYFSANREKFATDTTYTIRHLLIAKGEADLIALIDKIEKEIAAGADFEELVKRYSQGHRSDEGGLFVLTDKELDQRRRPIPEMVRKLEPGATSERIETDSAVHYIHLVRRVSGKQRTFEESQEDISWQINLRRREQQKARFDKELRDKAFIRIFLPNPGVP